MGPDTIGQAMVSKCSPHKRSVRKKLEKIAAMKLYVTINALGASIKDGGCRQKNLKKLSYLKKKKSTLGQLHENQVSSNISVIVGLLN